MIEQIHRNRINARVGDGDDGGRSRDDIVTERRTGTKLKRPPLYKVILLNDDYTPMEFVVDLLKAVFPPRRSFSRGDPTRKPNSSAHSSMRPVWRSDFSRIAWTPIRATI